MTRRTVAPQTGTAFELEAGETLVIIDPLGGQVADLFCFDAGNRKDALSSGRSIDYNETVTFSLGHLLYAQSGKPMLKITQDACGCHDFLVTPCSLQMFEMMGRLTDGYHPSCLENLEKHLFGFGIEPHQITTTFNVFMNVPIAANGRISVIRPKSQPGAAVHFEAAMNLVVGLTACSDEGSNGGTCKPIEFEVLPARVAG